MNPDRSLPGVYAGLSARQVQIADLVVTGRSNREIAEELRLSPRTVETHVSAIFDKLGVSTRVELTAAVVGARVRDGSGAAARTRTNLPRERSRLIGRERELDDVARLLSANRLVTVTGSGGAGKTRVAQSVGEGVLASEIDVWFVELAPISDGSSVPDAVARAMSLYVTHGQVFETIVGRIEERSLLLILDNCEHVIADVARFADALLQVCPGVRILATSREPLRIGTEQTYRLPSLRVPAAGAASVLDLEDAASFAAIELFAERARTVRHDFLVDGDNVGLVAEICRRLDGIPLAIELAAARVDTLSIGTLANHLDRRLPMLRGGDRLALPRHRTMHALIDWSYDLLTETERRLFDDLSVFAGAFGLNEATVVANAGEDTLTLLSALVEKSLLVADVSRSEPRYSFLETFRQYAAEKLLRRGETAHVLRRHALAYAALAETIAAEYDVAPTESIFARIAFAAENWRAALAWAIGERGDVVAGQRLAASVRGIFSSSDERWRWVALARDLIDDTTPRDVAARLERASAHVAHASNAYDVGIAGYGRAIEIFREIGDAGGVAHAQSALADALLNVGRFAEAKPLLESALAATRGEPRSAKSAAIFVAVSRCHFKDGDVERGRRLLRDALDIYESCGATRHASRTRISVAECEFGAGNAARALEIMEDRMRELRAGDDVLVLVQATCNSANYCIALGRFDDARAWAVEALDLAHRMSDRFGIAMAMQHLTAILALRGDDSHDDRERFADVVRLLGYVDGVLATIGDTRETYERLQYENVLAVAKRHLPAESVGPLLQEGEMMTQERAIARATRDPSRRSPTFTLVKGASATSER